MRPSLLASSFSSSSRLAALVFKWPQGIHLGRTRVSRLHTGIKIHDFTHAQMQPLHM